MTDAVREMERQNYIEARLCLIRAQQAAEEIFISDGEVDGIPTYTPE